LISAPQILNIKNLASFASKSNALNAPTDLVCLLAFLRLCLMKKHIIISVSWPPYIQVTKNCIKYFFQQWKPAETVGLVVAKM
jgi:hypothetical protein